MPRTKPGEYLVVARRGRLVNRGEAANAYLLPGTAWVKVPGTQLEAAFEMTQETKDGIPLRFKGIVIWRILRPEVAATLFEQRKTTMTEAVRAALEGLVGKDGEGWASPSRWSRSPRSISSTPASASSSRRARGTRSR